MPRIYLPVSHFKNNQITIIGERAHYLTSVLRCKKGDKLIIFDGEGTCFSTIIVRADKREMVAEVQEEIACALESPLNITLVQGILKGEKMDLVVQKTTELGIKEIVPVITQRSQLRETRKVERWRKISEEASRQSGRSVVPCIHEVEDFRNTFSSNGLCFASHGLIFYEEEGMKLSEAVSCLIPHPLSLFIFIGPEGGFTKEEVALAKEKGLLVTSLGKRILRSETAAISAVALVQYLLGDMD